MFPISPLVHSAGASSGAGYPTDRGGDTPETRGVVKVQSSIQQEAKIIDQSPIAAGMLSPQSETTPVSPIGVIACRTHGEPHA